MISPAKMQTPMRATGFKGLGIQRFQNGEIAPCLLATKFALLGHHQQQQQQSRTAVA